MVLQGLFTPVARTCMGRAINIFPLQHSNYVSKKSQKAFTLFLDLISSLLTVLH